MTATIANTHQVADQGQISLGERYFISLDLPSIVEHCSKKPFLDAAKQELDQFDELTALLFKAKQFSQMLAEHSENAFDGLTDADWQEMQTLSIRIHELTRRVPAPEDSKVKYLEQGRARSVRFAESELKAELDQKTKAGEADFSLNNAVKSGNQSVILKEFLTRNRSEQIEKFLGYSAEGFAVELRPLILEAQAFVQRWLESPSDSPLAVDQICGAGIAAYLLKSCFEGEAAVQVAMHLLGNTLYRSNNIH